MNRTCHLLGVLGLALTSGDALAAAGPSEGRKIEFTAPRETTPVRPMHGSEVRDFQSGFQRREPTSVMSDLPLGALPSSDDVDRRSRVLLELMEMRAGQLRDDIGGPGVSLDDPTGEEGVSGALGIDDARARQSRRGDRRGQSDGEGDNSAGSDRPRGDEFGPGRNPGAAGDLDRAGPNGARADSDNRRPRLDESFLPGMGGPGFLERDLDRSRPSENFLESGRFLNRSSFTSGSLDTERSRSEQRMESFRKLLPQNSRLDGLSGGLGSGAGRGPGNPTVPGLAPGGAGGGRTLSDALGGGPAGLGGNALGQDKSFAVPSRPVELDLGVGRTAARTSAEMVAPPATPRPMELFQRKHDNRIPTRGF